MGTCVFPVPLFADYSIIHAQSVPALQDNLGKIDGWLGRWKMSLNVDKCGVVVYGPRGGVSAVYLILLYQHYRTTVPEPANNCRSGLECNCARYKEKGNQRLPRDETIPDLQTQISSKMGLDGTKCAGSHSHIRVRAGYNVLDARYAHPARNRPNDQRHPRLFI